MWRGDVDRAVDRLQELPEDGGGYVAQDGSIAAGEHGCHEAFTEAERRVSHRVDPLVGTVKLAFANTNRDRFRSQAARFELLPRNRPVLPASDIRRCRIRRVEFCVHMDA